MDNKLKIVNFLGKHPDEEFTMHALSSILNIPYATFYRTIAKIKQLIVIKRIGKASSIRINLEADSVKSYLIISSTEESDEFLSRNPMIGKIASEISVNDIVLLFGSFAKGTQTEKSDIDILVINKKGEKSVSFSKYETLFKKKINPIFVTEKEFKEMLLEKEENVGKQALKNHIIINNPEHFWELVFNG